MKFPQKQTNIEKYISDIDIKVLNRFKSPPQEKDLTDK